MTKLKKVLITTMPFSEKYRAPLEISEPVDMFRVLEHEIKVKMIPTKHRAYDVDRKKDN